MGNQQQPSQRRIAKHPVQRMDLFVDSQPINEDEITGLRLAEEDWLDNFYSDDPEKNVVDTLNTHLSLERLAMKFGVLSGLPKLFYRGKDSIGAVDPTVWSSDYTNENIWQRTMLPSVPPWQMPDPKYSSQHHRVYPTNTWSTNLWTDIVGAKREPLLGEEDYMTELWKQQGYYGSRGPKLQLVLADRKKADFLIDTKTSEYHLLMSNPDMAVPARTRWSMLPNEGSLQERAKKTAEELAYKIDGSELEDEDGRLILRNEHGERYGIGPRPYVHLAPLQKPNPIYLNPFNKTKLLEPVRNRPLAIGEPYMQPDDNQLPENLQTNIRPEWLEELIYEKTGKDLGVTSCKNCSLLIKYENTDVHVRFKPNSENKSGQMQGFIVCRDRQMCASRADLQVKAYEETVNSALEGTPMQPKDITLNDVADASIVDEVSRENKERVNKWFASDASTSRRLEAAEMFFRANHIHRRDMATTLVTNLDDLVERDMEKFKKHDAYTQYMLMWVYSNKNGDYVLNPAKEGSLRCFIPPLFLGVLSTRTLDDYYEHAEWKETNINDWRRDESREYREKYGWDPDNRVEVYQTQGIPNMRTVETIEGSTKPTTRVIVTKCVTCGWTIDLYEKVFPDGTWVSREKNYEQSLLFKMDVPAPACYDYKQCALRKEKPKSLGEIEREREKTKLPWFLKWAMAGYPLEGQLLLARDEWILEMNHNCRWDLSTPIVYKKKEFVSRASKLREVLPAGIKPRLTF